MDKFELPDITQKALLKGELDESAIVKALGNIDMAFKTVAASLKNMFNNADYNKYWMDQEQLIERVTDAYRNYVNVQSSNNAEELIKSVNALKAVSDDIDLGKVIRGVDLSRVFDEAMEKLESGARQTIASMFSPRNFREAFSTFDAMLEQMGDRTSVVKLVERVQTADQETLAAELERQRSLITKLEDQLSWAEYERDEFRKSVNEYESGEEIKNLKKTEQTYNFLISKMKQEFASFLSSNDLDDRFFGRFKEQFDGIASGALTARQAITKVREELIKSGQLPPAFNNEQFDNFVKRLDEVASKIDEVKAKLDKGVKVSGTVDGVAEQMKETVTLSEEQVKAINNITDGASALSYVAGELIKIGNAGKEVGEDFTGAYDSLSKFMSQLRDLGKDPTGAMQLVNSLLISVRSLGKVSVDTKGLGKIVTYLTSLSGTATREAVDTLRRFGTDLDFSKLQNLGIDEKALQSVKTFAEGLRMISELTKGKIEKVTEVINNTKFTKLGNVKVDKKSFETLAQYLPTISKADAANLERLSKVDLTNFNNVKVSKESLEGIANLTESLRILQQTKAAVAQANKDSIVINPPGGGSTNASKITDYFVDGEFDSRVSVYKNAARGFTETIREAYQETEDGERELTEIARSEATNYEAIQKQKYTNALNVAKEYYAAQKELIGVTGVQQGADGRYSTTNQAAYGALVQRLNETKTAYDNLTEAEKRLIAEDEKALELNLREAEGKSTKKQQAEEEAAAYKNATQVIKEYYAAQTALAELKANGTVIENNGAYTVNSTAENPEAGYSVLTRIRSTKAAYDDLMKTLKALGLTERDITKIEQLDANLKQKLAEATDKYNKKAQESLLNEQKHASFIKQTTDALTGYVAAMVKGKGVDAESIVKMQELIDAYQKEYEACKNNTGSYEELARKKKELTDYMGYMKDKSDEAAKSMMSFGEKIKNVAWQFGIFLSTRMIMMRVIRKIREMINEVVELGDAIAQMQIVTGASDITMNKFAESAVSAATRLGVSATDYISGATTYARLGYSFEDSKTLSEYTTMLQKVGDVDATQAQEAVTSIIKAFSKDAGDIEDVMDKLVIVGNNFPISVSEIAEGVTNMSSALGAAGNDFEQSIALLTAANTTVQNASRASTGLRTISARIRNTKVDLDELGEEMTEEKYGELVKALTDAKVRLTDVNGEYRSTYDIMKDLASVWDDLSSKEQAALATNIAGTRQQDVFYSIVNQFQEAENAYAMMTEKSSGALSKAYDIYLDTAKAHINQMKDALTELSQALFKSGTISFFVDIAKYILKAATALQKVKALLPTIVSSIAAIKYFKIAKNLQQIITLSNLVTANIVKNGTATAADAAAISGLTLAQKAKIASDIQAQMSAKGVAQAEIDAALASAGLSAQMVGLSASNHVAALSFKALWGAITSNPIGAILSILTVAISIVARIKQNAEEAKQAAQEAREKQMETANAAVDEANAIAESYQAYLDAKSAVDDTIDSKSALADVTNELLEKLGYERTEVEKLAGAYGGLDAAIGAVAAVGLREKANTAREGMIAARDDALAGIEDFVEKAGYSDSDIHPFLYVYNNGDRNDPLFALLQETLMKVDNYASQYGNAADSVMTTLDLLTNVVPSTGYFGYDYDNESMGTHYGEYEGLIADLERLKTLQGELVDGAKAKGISKDELFATEYYSAITSTISKIEEYKEKVDEFESSANDAYVRANYYEYIASHGLPETTAGFSKMVSAIGDAVIANDEFVGSEDNVADAVKNVLSTIPDLKDFYDDAEERQRLIEEITFKSHATPEIIELGMVWDEATGTYSVSMKKALEEIRNMTTEELKRLRNQISSDKIGADVITDALFGALKTDAISAYREQLDEFHSIVSERPGGDDAGFLTAVFGNIDLNKRQILEWTDANIETFREAIKSWEGENEDLAEEMRGSISTVFGGAETFSYRELGNDSNGYYDVVKDIDIAFSPILQTEDGPVLLSRDAVYQYIEELINTSIDVDGKLNANIMLANDTKGLIVDGIKIKNIIADIGETAVNTSEIMHYLGTDGSIALALNEAWDDDATTEGLQKIADLYTDLIRYSDEEIELAYRIVAEPGSMTLDEMIDKIRDVHTQHSNEVYAGVQDVTEKIGLLKDIYTDVKDGGDFDWSKFINNKDFTEAFSQCEASYESFKKVVAENPNNITAVQQAFDDLVTELVLTSGALDNVTSSEKDTVVAMLKAVGVTNAEEKITEMLGNKTEALALMKIRLLGETGRLTNAEYEEAAARMSVAEATDVTNQALAQYMLAKIQDNQIKINTSSDVENLIALANAAGASILAINKLTKIKAAYAKVESIYANAVESGNLNANELRHAEAALSNLEAQVQSILNGTFDYGLKLNASDFLAGTSGLGGFSFDGSAIGTDKNSNNGGKSDSDNWFIRRYKELNHEINMERATQQEYLDWLSWAYKQAYDEGIISLDDYRKYEEEVLKLEREIFKDYLSDIEQMISNYSFEGDYVKQAELYKQLIEAVEAEIARLREAGLTDNDAYLQEMLKKWASYYKSYQDLYTKAEDEAEKNIQKLIDFRIKMLKQEIKDQRDAIKKQLDALKDFYDKQKKMLDDAKDEDKYLEEQSEKRMAVTKLEMQLRALEADDSAWAAKKKLELREDLAKAQKELDDFERDHAIETAKDQLDEMYELQKSELEAQDELLEKQENDAKALYEQALADIKNGSIALYEEMINYNNLYGDGIQQTITDMWESAYDSLKKYYDLNKQFYEDIVLANVTGATDGESFDNMAVSGNGTKSGTEVEPHKNSGSGGIIPGDIDGDGKVTAADARLATRLMVGHTDPEAKCPMAGDLDGDGKITAADARRILLMSVGLDDGYASGTSSASSGIHEIDEKGSETIFESADGRKYKLFTGGEKVLSAKASDFLYRFATRGAELFDRMFGAPGMTHTPAFAGAGGIAITQGDIIIEGNADRATVSEIRRAQRDSVNYMLKELTRLQR